MTLTQDGLRKVAAEINGVCEFSEEDAINPNQEFQDLKAELINEVSGEKPNLELFENDDFSNETWTLLAELGCKVAGEVVSKEEESTAKSTEENEETMELEENEETMELEENEKDGEMVEENGPELKDESEEIESEEEPDLVLDITESQLDNYKRKSLLQLVEDHKLKVDTNRNTKTIKKEIKNTCYLRTEPEEEKKGWKHKERPRIGGLSSCSYIHKCICLNPEISNHEIYKELGELGMNKISSKTVNILRRRVLEVVYYLHEAGISLDKDSEIVKKTEKMLAKVNQDNVPKPNKRSK